MFRKPAFWIFLILASVGGVYFSFTFFPQAFPVVTLDLRMSRETALEKAAELASRLQLPPEGYRQAASFSGSQKVQNFVELEGGGTDAFRKMMAEGLFHPYQWTVRHFKPGETKEAEIFFTPGGDAYGFRVKLPEKEAGAALSPEQARAIAEQSAARDWRVDLSRYKLEETSQEVRPGGRIDHTFVYERPDVRIGEGRYRLLLETGGDRLTRLIPSVKVPEAFSRRYEEMRSANTFIGGFGTIALGLFYLLGGCGVGLFFLLRRRGMQWRPAILWGGLIAFLQLLAQINEWPLLWMNYDTAVALPRFVSQQLVFMLLAFLGYAALFILSFAMAEGLTRLAFPDRLQTWRLWTGGVSGSKAVLGQTVAGYLLVGVFFAYEVLLYLTASRSFGWWSPSDTLVQPDILAHYLPWLNPIAISAQAGFWEECLFRAVPLAGAALLGNRFGRRTWWLSGAMVLQAVIFGAGHAGYANQPAYARLVELILPSLMFGGLYLLFGLLPGIVLHYAFDVVWFALPLFVSTAPGILWNRALVILLVLIPLWVVVSGRVRARKWSEIPEEAWNRSWKPSEEPEVFPAPEAAVPARSAAMGRSAAAWLAALGALGLVVWFLTAFHRTDAPGLTLSRSDALQKAGQALADRGIRLPETWTALASIATRPSEADRFVWQTADRSLYPQLMGQYLAPPHWQVRFVRFTGDVAERAEEYQLAISEDKGVYRFRHLLPEDRPGKNLGEPEARELARQELKAAFGLDPAALKEVSSVPSKLKDRTDWVFTFSDPRPPVLPKGEKRLAVKICGDQPGDAYRFVHVPEEWQREQQDRETVPRILQMVCTLGVVALVIYGVAAAIFSWSRKRFVPSTFLLLFLLLALLTLASLLNSIPATAAQFSTAQPFKVQMFLLLAGGALGLLVVSLCMGLTAGLVHLMCRSEAPAAAGPAWRAGLSLGGIAVGVTALADRLAPSLRPQWGDFTHLGQFSPFLGAALGPVSTFLVQALIALLLFGLADRISGGWSRNKVLAGIFLFFFGFLAAGSHGVETLPSWLLGGGITGLLLPGAYIAAIRYSLPMVIFGIGLIQVLDACQEALSAATVPNLSGTAAAVVLTGVLAVFWHRRLSGAGGPQREASANPEG